MLGARPGSIGAALDIKRLYRILRGYIFACHFEGYVGSQSKSSVYNDILS
jgi:hypothetical protein